MITVFKKAFLKKALSAFLRAVPQAGFCYLFFLSLLIPSRSSAADYRWTGAIDSTWTVAGNWDPSGPPGTSDTAIIDTNTVSQPVIWGPVSVYSVYIATSGVYGSTLTINYPITASSMVVVGAKGVITHTGNISAEVYRSSIAAGEMQVNGLINVSGKGYLGGYGPGARNSSGYGGGYGGQGGVNSEANTPGLPYGSYSAPVNLGSGGSSTVYPGSSGGGAIILNVSGTLTVTGQILSTGAYQSYGGGSGGSIYITGGALAGSGIIRADGANSTGNGTGAGGRIAVIASTSGFSGSITAFAGTNSSGYSGGGGTVFIKTPGNNGTLIIDNNNIATNRYTQIASDDYTGDFDQVRLNKRGNLWLNYPSTITINSVIGDGTTGYLRVDDQIKFTPGAYTMSGFGLLLSSMTNFSGLTDLIVGGSSGAVITHEQNNATEVHKASFSVTNLTIASNGLIDVSCKGYYGGRGPGTRNLSTYGGAYGGQGGVISEVNTPGAPYGSYSAPVNLGSGGDVTTYTGSSGGGALILNVPGTLTMNGSILSEGCMENNTGAGSGGSIYITGGAIVGNGDISARGGQTGAGFGRGGGGRVAVIASTSGFTGPITAFGGTTTTEARAGGAGTVFIKTPGTNGTLIVDNDNIATNRYTQISTGNYSGVFDQVRLNRRGNFRLAYPSTITINSVIGDGTTPYLRVDGEIDFAGAYTMSGFGLLLSSMTSLSGLTDLTVGGSSGAVVTHEFNTSAEVHKASISVTNLTIAANSKIDVSCKGYAGGYGPGTRDSNTYGGGYGGQGGVTNEANIPGSTYGSYLAPVNLGSGGGTTGLQDSGGGGALILNVPGTLTLTGQILSEGCMQTNSGAGSGGSIYITGGALAGNGGISARGGQTGSGYGRGGGGRVAVIASTSGFSGSITAFGGTSAIPAYAGGAGTVFIKTPGTNGMLIIDNNNIATNRYTGILAANSIFDSVYSVRKSSGVFLSFSTVTIKGENAFFDGDNTSTIAVSGNVYGGSFPEVYLSSFSVKWGAAGNPSSANYTAEISTFPDYSVIEKSSATYNRNAFLTGVLEPNTTYYARVKTPNYATLKLLTTNYVVIGATVTLAAKPGTPANPFTGVYLTSVTLNWLANGNPAYTEYRVQASTASDFTGTLYGPATGPSNWLIGTSTTVVSLPGGGATDCGLRMYDGAGVVSLACFNGSLYYFHVQARNMNNIETEFEVLGSTTVGSVPKLTIHKNGTNYGVTLVDPADPNASKIKIQTPEGIKAIRKYP